MALYVGQRVLSKNSGGVNVAIRRQNADAPDGLFCDGRFQRLRCKAVVFEMPGASINHKSGGEAKDSEENHRIYADIVPL
jgi:hypothetical protein